MRLQWRKCRCEFIRTCASPDELDDVGAKSFARAPEINSDLLGQRRKATGLASALPEKLLDFLRSRVERLARARLADKRLVQTQAQHLLDLRALGVAQFLLREL